MNDMPWTFNPVNPEAWAQAQVRVLLLGAEPNGDNPHGGQLDMGQWFATASQQNQYHHNQRFFLRSLAQLAGALNETGSLLEPGSLTPEQLPELQGLQGCLRYADLKATPGGANAVANAVDAYVQQHLATILEFWLPRDGQPAAPTVTVLQGGTAQTVFCRQVLPVLREEMAPGSFIGMPHPSEQRSYEILRKGVVEMPNKLVHLAGNGHGVRWAMHERQMAWLDLE